MDPQGIASLAFETLGALVGAIGRILAMRNQDAARRALERLRTHARQVDAEVIALEAARAVQRPDRDDG